MYKKARIEIEDMQEMTCARIKRLHEPFNNPQIDEKNWEKKQP